MAKIDTVRQTGRQTEKGERRGQNKETKMKSDRETQSQNNGPTQNCQRKRDGAGY